VQPDATLTFGDSPLVSALTVDPGACRPRCARAAPADLADFFALLRQHAAQQR
jgi:hypothetical protein